VSAYVASLFGREYFIAPIQFTGSDSVASIAGYIARPVPTGIRYFGYVLTTFRKEPDGRWRIASEMYKFPGPRGPDPETPEQLITLLDAAGIRKALVLSTAYWFGHGNGPAAPDEYERVRAENDSVSQQVARFPDRLVGFFSVNPLKDYAVQEIERCANDPHLKGMKLHFGDSEVNVLDPGHVAKVRRVFEAANSHHLPIVVHLMTADTAYGRAQSLAFLEKILPAAPDIPVQIAHLAGSGPQYNSDPAFAVFSEAAARHDPRMKNVYTDVATVVTLTTPPKSLALIARRLREFGLSHVLYGSDTPASLDITPESGWLAFRRLPMSDREFKRIADNITPYMR
jgi:predicted TIM-barrel fold metal-dependent hydrolase